ncbi:(4Fe-4S)-binding protein [Nocardioides pantholopis]|uniref:(4Fe-4S)-binding protein n=1 Tax=Nocardioides pantholopis TaxID=2483798 RepID=UPI000FD85C20|nr:(4Fe-4S)-binding protein [Nocardioides pantholopis]
MVRKIYTGPVIDVSFDGEICQHAAECVRGMPAVFDPARRPWIDPGQADTEAAAEMLRAVIARCPSGALSVVEHDRTDEATPSTSAPAESSRRSELG